MEITITSALVHTVYATAVIGPKRDTLGTTTDKLGTNAPIAVGFIIRANILVAGPFSGGWMNPARSVGPAVVNKDFHNNWIY
ncbi:hypothetical protein ACSBR2_042895 [Camellia fascicularis]